MHVSATATFDVEKASGQEQESSESCSNNRMRKRDSGQSRRNSSVSETICPMEANSRGGRAIAELSSS